jgi:hypothetical protein
MHVEYNGVKLKLTEITECSRRAVYDPSGTDLLYVKWRVGVVATLASGGHPSGTAADSDTRASWHATLAELEGGNIDVDRGVPPALGKDAPEYDWPAAPDNDPLRITNPAFMSDVELRMRLMVPRRKLRITAYHPDGREYVWLESPRPWVPSVQQVSGGRVVDDDAQKVEGVVDADNGPKPLLCDVVQPVGEGTSMGVHFVIETCVVPVDPQAERLVLSHRWETTMSHDDDHYLTRTTVGEIRFNAQILHAAKAQPDWFRGQFFHPIPLGFRRGGPVVRQSPDGLTLQYEIHDTDPTVVFDPGDSGATSMSIVETIALDQRGVWANHLVNGMQKLLTGGLFDQMGRQFGPLAMKARKLFGM